MAMFMKSESTIVVALLHWDPAGCFPCLMHSAPNTAATKLKQQASMTLGYSA